MSDEKTERNQTVCHHRLLIDQLDAALERMHQQPGYYVEDIDLFNRMQDQQNQIYQECLRTCALSGPTIHKE